jgi:diacylglycerol O-acyltransferase
LADLPVEVADPYDRLLEVAVRLQALKRSHEAEAGEIITGVADALPPPLVAGFLHLAFRTPHRHLTTVVTNVPGPSEQLYLAGRPMLATYPYVPIGDRLRSGVAVTTYQGRLFIGVTTDRYSMPDAGLLADELAAGFATMIDLARGRPETLRSPR